MKEGNRLSIVDDGRGKYLVKDKLWKFNLFCYLEPIPCNFCMIPKHCNASIYKVNPLKYVYSVTFFVKLCAGANRYYYMCMNEFLAFGGGGSFALCLDEDL